MLHDEPDRTAALAAGKALAIVAGWRYHEGWCAVVVKGAETFQVGPSTLQGDEVGDNIDDVCSIQYLVNGYAVYHDSSLGY